VLEWLGIGKSGKDEKKQSEEQSKKEEYVRLPLESSKQHLMLRSRSSSHIVGESESSSSKQRRNSAPEIYTYNSSREEMISLMSGRK
jgi:hypothetical protein